MAGNKKVSFFFTFTLISIYFLTSIFIDAIGKEVITTNKTSCSLTFCKIECRDQNSARFGWIRKRNSHLLGIDDEIYWFFDSFDITWIRVDLNLGTQNFGALWTHFGQKVYPRSRNFASFPIELHLGFAPLKKYNVSLEMGQEGINFEISFERNFIGF